MGAEDGLAPVQRAQARVAIVGLGLMGGRLAAALMTGAGEGSPVCREVVGVARDAMTLALAQNLRFIHRGYTEMAAGVRGADVVILATPVRDILRRIGEIGPLLKPGCVLLDLGSTKRAICAAMEALPAHVQPVGGHPMCGKETSGLTVAEPGLFRERVFVLCALARTRPGRATWRGSWPRRWARARCCSNRPAMTGWRRPSATCPT
jgi:prephenate dehydrogenase